jgi:hypothetical protein
MVPSINTILQRFSEEWAALLQPDAILTVCRDIGYTAWRDRVLTPATTIQVFLLQILHGNTVCSHLPHLSGLRFTAAAYCQSRARLPLLLLLDRFCSSDNLRACLPNLSRQHTGDRLCPSANWASAARW